MFRLTFLVAMLAACMTVSAAPQDLWNPKITSPTAGTIWAAGSIQKVTWDTSDAPPSISEGSKVLLAKGGVQDVDHPLAQGFDLRSGSVSVTVPATTEAGADYAIVLFGDSGNVSPEFTIV